MNNRVMLVGRIQEIVEENNICNISLKVRKYNSDVIVVHIILKVNEDCENIKERLLDQSIIGVYGYLDGIKDKLVIVANKITLLDKVGVENE